MQWTSRQTVRWNKTNDVVTQENIHGERQPKQKQTSIIHAIQNETEHTGDKLESKLTGQKQKQKQNKTKKVRVKIV